MPGTLDMASMVTWQTVYCCILRSDCCCYHHILDNIQIGSQFGCDVLHHHHHHHYRQRMCFVGSDGDGRIKSMPPMQARLPRFPKTVLDFKRHTSSVIPAASIVMMKARCSSSNEKGKNAWAFVVNPCNVQTWRNRFVG